MAQVCGGSTYDWLWDSQLVGFLNFIRRIADACAAQKLVMTPSSAIFGAILHPLAYHYSVKRVHDDLVTFDTYSRQPEQFSMTQVLCSLHPGADKIHLEFTAQRIEHLISTAIHTWTTTGYPEVPPTLQVLDQIISITFAGGFTKCLPGPWAADVKEEKQAIRHIGNGEVI